MSFVRRRLEAESVNVFKTAFRDRRRRKTETYAWEAPLARIARLLTAILARPLEKGLRPSPDGFFPVKDLLQLPLLQGLDFFSIERAVRMYRSQHIILTYNPRTTNPPADDESITSWWISPCPSKTFIPPRRLLPSDQVPDLVFKLPSALWETVREQGITRWPPRPLVFHSRHTVSAKYSGDYTFIRLDPQKLTDSTQNHPIHSTRRHTTRPVFHQSSESFTTNAPNIPPSTFKFATRITVERFPLMVSANTLSNASQSNNRKQKRPPKKKKRKKEKENQQEKMVVLQSGIDALDKFGYGDVLRGTKLLQLWEEQQAKTKAQPVPNQYQKPSPKMVATTQVASPTRNPKKSRRLSTKDPPPHTTRL